MTCADRSVRRKSSILIGLCTVVVALPLLLSWWVGEPARPFHQELASGLGMLAFAIILVECVLSDRFKSISSGIGMNVTMRFHQLMAHSGLLFAVLHPFLYGPTQAGDPRPWDPTRQLTLTTDLSDIWSGMVAFALLPSFALLAIFRRHLGYTQELWRLMYGGGAETFDHVFGLRVIAVAFIEKADAHREGALSQGTGASTSVDAMRRVAFCLLTVHTAGRDATCRSRALSTATMERDFRAETR